MNDQETIYSRRNVIAGAGLAGTALVLGQTTFGAATAQPGTRPTRTAPPATPATPPTMTPQMGTPSGTASQQPSVPELLTEQHAVAGRLLLIYSTATSWQTGMTQVTPPPTSVIGQAAQMLRDNVDDYHVKLEDQYIFPLFQKAARMSDLINTLRQQHEAARRLTDAILKAAQGGAAAGGNQQSLNQNLMAYTHMIQAHTAYEETQLYPQLRTVISAAEYDQLLKTIQDQNREKLGSQGLQGLVLKVQELERTAGITGLAQFTPSASRQTAMGTPGQR